SELGEGVIAACEGRLGRVALAPEPARDRPADLQLEVTVQRLPDAVHPALGVPEEIADPADELPVLLAQDAEEAEPVPFPMSEHAVDRTRHLVAGERRPAQKAH